MIWVAPARHLQGAASVGNVGKDEGNEDRYSLRHRGGMQRLAIPQEATVCIADRQWIAIVTVVRFELTFEASAPDIVGNQDLTSGLTGMAEDPSMRLLGAHTKTG